MAVEFVVAVVPAAVLASGGHVPAVSGLVEVPCLDLLVEGKFADVRAEIGEVDIEADGKTNYFHIGLNYRK